MKKALVVFTIVGLALAGCGGSSAKDADTGSSGTGAGGDDDTTSNNEAFGKLLDLENGESIRVTYDYGDDEDDQMTVSRDGQGKVAYLTGDSQAIFDGDTVIECKDLASTPQCKQYSGNLQRVRTAYTGFLGDATNLLAALDKVPDAYRDQTSEEIAGREATCATVTPASAPGVAGDILGRLEGVADLGANVCADDETGIMLKFETVGVDDDRKRLIVATEVGDPEDSDFDPPVEPERTTVPSIPDDLGGITIPGISP